MVLCYDRNRHKLEAVTVPLNLILIESPQCLLSYGPDEQAGGRKLFHSPPFSFERAGAIKK